MTKNFSNAAVLTLLCAGLSSAQVSTATLLGTVSDPSGGVIAGATVQATNLGTRIVRSARTDAAGDYVITNLPAAHYAITVKESGFKAYTIADVELLVAQRAKVNITLQVGAVQQEVTVAATTPMVETAQSSIGEVVNTTLVQHMPLNGRSFWQLTDLTPGATYTPGGQNTHTGGSAIRSSVVNVTINGAPPDQTGWYLDGAYISEVQQGGTLIQPNVDAIQEFKVEGANMPAEFGHSPNVVNVTLKSGTNQFHGTAFEFLRNSAFDARNFFYIPPVGSNETTEPLRRNQYGFALGGPIRHNKTFFFVDLEKTGLLQGIDFSNVVPSEAQRGGDFSQLLQEHKPVQLVNPTANYQPFAGNLIPPSLISPQATFFLPYLPTPNTVRGSTSYSALTNNMLQGEYRGDIRIDEQISDSTQLAGRYSVNDNTEDDPNAYVTLGTTALHSRAQNPSISLTHIFSPHWLNQARFSYYRSYFYFAAELQGTNFNQEAGAQGFSDTAPTALAGFPEIELSGYSTFQGAPADQRPKQNRIRDYQYADDLSYSSGPHNIKMGASLMHVDAAYIASQDADGVFDFVGTYTGDAFADFLLGYPDNVNRSPFHQLFGDWENFWGFYVQDDYRVTHNLTLNLGLRLNLNGFYNGIRGQKSAFNLATGKVVIPSSIDPGVQAQTPTLMTLFSDRIQYTKSLGLPDSIQPMQKNWAPRIGFAWTPFGGSNFVLRGAFGIFYILPDNSIENNTVQTVPFFAQSTVFNDRPPAAPTRTWGDFFLGQPTTPLPNPNPGQPCAFGFAALSCATPNMNALPIVARSEAMDSWNFAIERQLTSGTSLDVAYVGNKTSHLLQNTRINDPLPGPGDIQSRRPYPQWGSITNGIFGLNANYNALQLKYTARNWHGLNGLVSYSYSKCISEQGTTLALQPFSRGVCSYDMPQTFAGSFDYILPFGRGREFMGNAHGLANQLVNGWELAGILTLRSGLPFTPSINGDIANTGVGQRPDVIGSPTIVGNVSCWFYVSTNSACRALDPSGVNAFAVPAKYTYGNAGLYILRSDGLKQLDFTVMKDFPITESKKLQFRAEMFNILNHPTFSAPSSAINSSSAGQVSSTLNAARIIQLALKFTF